VKAGRWLRKPVRALDDLCRWAVGFFRGLCGSISLAATSKSSDTCAASLLRGYTDIPNVVITRWVQAHSRPSKLWGVWLILISEWPLYLNALMVLIHRQWAATKGYATLWIAGFGLSVALMLVAAMAAWTFATERAGRFDEMIKNSPARLSVPAWMDRFMSLRRQPILPVLGAISGPIHLYFVRGALEHDVGIAFPSYVLVSWVSFVGGVDVYWLWVATGRPKKIFRCGDLDLRWQDPSSTPGLRLLSDSYGISGLFLLAGLINISVLGFIVPRLITTNANAILYTLFAFFAIVFITSIRVVIVPLIWAWLIITRSKRASMSLLNAKLPSSSNLAMQADYGQVGDLTALYDSVSGAPALPFSTSALVQYFAALAGAVFAFFFGLISGSH
jgi:hypothetical protein